MATYVQLVIRRAWCEAAGDDQRRLNKSGEAMPDMEGDVDQIFEFLGPTYGEVSPDGIDHFKVVATKIGEMAAVEPNLQASDLADVPQRTLVMFSDDDLMTMTHVVETYDDGDVLRVMARAGRVYGYRAEPR